MGQQEVYDFLKRFQNQWFTSKEIAKELDLSMGSVTSNLKKLRKSQSIAFQLQSKNGKRNYIYCYKVNRVKNLMKKILQKDEF
jgi:predicted transcriptional regulator